MFNKTDLKRIDLQPIFRSDPDLDNLANELDQVLSERSKDDEDTILIKELDSLISKDKKSKSQHDDLKKLIFRI